MLLYLSTCDMRTCEKANQKISIPDKSNLCKIAEAKGLNMQKKIVLDTTCGAGKQTQNFQRIKLFQFIVA